MQFKIYNKQKETLSHSNNMVMTKVKIKMTIQTVTRNNVLLMHAIIVVLINEPLEV